MGQTDVGRRSFIKAAIAAGVAAVVVGGGLYYWFSAGGGGRRTLYIYNWYEDWGQWAEQTFEAQKAGVDVVWTTYDSNEVWYTAIVGNQPVDIAVGETDWVQKAIAEGLAQPIDEGKIPNLRYVDPRLLEPFKKDGRLYSVPISVGMYCLLYNKNRVSPEPDSWGVLWDEKYKGKILMPDYGIYAVQMTALYIGDDPYNPKKWDEIKELLIQQKPLVKKYWSSYEEAMQLFISEDVWVGLLTAGRAIRAAKEYNWPGTFTVPKEGAMTWIDSQFIAKTSQNPDLAHEFINFSLSGEAGAKFIEIEKYKHVSSAALEKIAPEDRKFYEWPKEWKLYPMVALSEDVRRKIDELWTEVKLA